MKTVNIILYDEPTVPEINLDAAVKFIKDTFNVPVEKRGPINLRYDKDILYKIAASRIKKLNMPFQRHVPTFEEIEFEKNTTHSSMQGMTYYDGFELQSALCRLLSKTESTENVFHIIFTNRLTCTFSHTDYRYHGRALVCSNPAIISTTGIIEAPAKPREYYSKSMAYSKMGLDLDEIKKKFRGTFLEYHDSRLAEIIQGYIMQAIFYYESMEAFCSDVNCRLYNAHWQKDLLHSQLEIGKLCKKHQDMLSQMTNKT